MTKPSLPGDWRPVKDYESEYLVNDVGQIWSIPRKSTRFYKRGIGGRLLRPGLSGDGYYVVTLWKTGDEKRGGGTKRHIHRIVAEAFIGPKPKGKVTNHKNCDKLDNRAENLEYVSSAENVKHARANGRIPNWGEKNWHAKLNEYQVRIIRRCQGELTLMELSEIFGVKFQGISKIWQNKVWAHVEHPDYQSMLDRGEPLRFGPRTLEKLAGTLEEDLAIMQDQLLGLAEKHACDPIDLVKCLAHKIAESCPN